MANKYLSSSHLNFTIISIIAVLPALFLLINRYPWLNIAVYMVLIWFSVIAFLKNSVITRYHYHLIIILALIFVYFLATYVISGQPVSSLFTYSFLRWDGGFFFSYLAFFIFAIPFLNYQKTLALYFQLLFVIFVLFSVWGLIEYFTGYHLFTVRIDDIYLGPMFVALNNSHNATGSAYAAVSVFTLSYLLSSEKKYKFFYTVVLIFCFIGLFITKSRGSLIGFACGAVVVIFLHVKSIKKFLAVILILLLLMAPIIYFTGTYDRIAQIFSVKDLNAQTRLGMWGNAWRLFLASPIFGIGFARYNDVAWFDQIVDLEGIEGLVSFYAEPRQVFDASNAHNSYLHLLAENGIVGLILLLFFWIYCAYLLYRKYTISTSANHKVMYLASIGGIATLFGLSLTEHYMASPTVMVCLSIAISLAMGTAWEEDIKNAEQ